MFICCSSHCFHEVKNLRSLGQKVLPSAINIKNYVLYLMRHDIVYIDALCPSFSENIHYNKSLLCVSDLVEALEIKPSIWAEELKLISCHPVSTTRLASLFHGFSNKVDHIKDGPKQWRHLWRKSGKKGLKCQKKT